MKRRIFVLPLATISLLISCTNTPELRSDIAKFVASFSYNEARKVYLESSYTREDISHEENGDIITINESMSINLKDVNNLGYDYTFSKKNGDEVLESHHYYIEKSGEDYLYHYVDAEPVVKTSEQVMSTLISKFFYRSSLEGTHYLGMYVGDYLLEVLPYIQKFVTTDFDNNTLTYDIPIGEKKDAEGYDFSELLIVDQHGMTKSCDIYQTNGKTILETTIRVTNVI